jgi:hypothetical protein
METRTKSVSFAVTAREKAAIRQAAAREDVTMAEFVRRRTLDNITPKEPAVGDEEPQPLEDFITARLHRDADADPLPKQEVYTAYQDFCEELYPEHSIETQHKLTLEIGQLDGVTTGRAYVERGGELEHKRCFHGLRWSNPE